jgi:hypothetical protein
MTLVVGQQFADRLVFLSDSMITDPMTGKLDVLPGQLKTVILNEELSVSFAGRLNQALDTIREIKSGLTDDVQIESVLEHLRVKSIHGLVDFLVGSRVPEPRLYKISQGQVNRGADRYWIGDQSGVSALQRLFDSQPDDQFNAIETVSTEELKLWLSFHELVSERHHYGIGGLAFYCAGSAEGFCYYNHAGFFGYGSVTIPETEVQSRTRLDLEKTGMGPTYSYSITTSPYRGVAVVGAFFPQGDFGFMYSPIDLDRPLKYYPIALDELQKRVTEKANSMIPKRD